ncbi:pyridoxal-phosphate dependent enzyme, partial [Haloarcula sp. JP-Z28]|uniref:pyridoxal-phosphate dependent enzyme n=1 Tax=Haloarcula sp. JP-Z28 TaxID=2716715 RepID=UPI001404C3B5
EDTRRWDDVETRATAIRIGNPVNAPKALPGIRETGGTAVAVSDEEITEAQRDIAGEGVGVEPASAASVAGLRKLRREGEVDSDESVVCLTTGHLLKDPEAAAEAGNEPEPVANSTEAVLDLIEEPSSVAQTVRRQASKAADAPLVPALVASGLGVAYLYRKLRSKK